MVSKIRSIQLIFCTLSCSIALSVIPAESPKKALKKKRAVVEEEAEPGPKTGDSPSSPKKSKQDEESRKSLAAPNATIATENLVEFENSPARVRTLIESALALTAQDLTYTYGSSDPANGGMDCSGFVYYILKQSGYADVPRDASGHYVWVRKAGTFRAVLSHRAATFELDDLKPGDLLFWTGTYVTDHDPPVTHSMIYLGTEKKTKNKVMVGSSDGRSYQGKSRWGVSVFDFKIPAPDPNNPVKRSVFAGYARIPGLRDEGTVSSEKKSTAEPKEIPSKSPGKKAKPSARKHVPTGDT